MRPPCPAVALPTLLSRLRACRSASHALQCHALLLTSGHLAASPLRLSNLLLLALASVPSAAALADVVFARLPLPAARDPFAWNTAIRLHAPARPRAALLYFARMRRCGVRPDAYTFPAVLKACGCAPGCRAGLLVHAEAVRRGLAADLFTVNALISFYCRILDYRLGRQRVLRGRRGLMELHSRWVRRVPGDGARAGAVRRNATERRVLLGVSIDGYGWKQGGAGVDRARELSDQMPKRNFVCWNLMIDGDAGQGRMH